MSSVYLTFLRGSRAVAAAIPRHHKAAHAAACAAAAEVEAECLAALPRAPLLASALLRSPLPALTVLAAMACVVCGWG